MKDLKNIFILGANGSIGFELVCALRTRHPNSRIFGSFNQSRELSKLENIMDGVVQLDVRREESWLHIREYLKELGVEFDLVISTIGTLEGAGKIPEKSLKDINLKQLESVFSINAFHSVFTGKEFKNYLNRSNPSKLVFLSAMVGSIGENDIGGWYSYRASKTALNMFVKNMSIEFNRLSPDIKVLAIHPGTTDTPFSNKYLKGVKHKVWTASETANHILNVIDDSSLSSGSFVNWDNRIIEW